jgi:hypothetical protein
MLEYPVPTRPIIKTFAAVGWCSIIPTHVLAVGMAPAGGEEFTDIESNGAGTSWTTGL